VWGYYSRRGRAASLDRRSRPAGGLSWPSARRRGSPNVLRLVHSGGGDLSRDKERSIPGLSRSAGHRASVTTSAIVVVDMMTCAPGSRNGGHHGTGQGVRVVPGLRNPRANDGGTVRSRRCSAPDSGPNNIKPGQRARDRVCPAGSRRAVRRSGPGEVKSCEKPLSRRPCDNGEQVGGMGPGTPR